MSRQTNVQTCTRSDAPDGSWGACVVVDAAVRDLPGSGTVGRYRIDEVIGAGAMGRVYRGWDPDLSREVAIKVVRGISTEQARARLLREARALACFEHPNIVPVYDVGIDGDCMYVVMQLLHCQTLRGWLAAQARSWEQVLDVFVEAGRALSAVHAAGLGHRDFKPDNLVITDDGHVKLVDFGLAKCFDDGNEPSVDPLGTLSGSTSEAGSGSVTVTRSGVIIGTPAYMAPEQYRRRCVDARADQFSYCVALWEAMFGRRPFNATKTSRLAVRICRGRIDAPLAAHAVPPAIETVLRRGLSPLAEHRFATVAALVDALERARAAALEEERSQVADPAELERAQLQLIRDLAVSGRMREATALLESLGRTAITG
jgi:serine/threonine protein kinase